MKYHIIYIILCSTLSASSNHIGMELSLSSIIPFLGLLLSIAIIPLVAPIVWHQNYGKIAGFWALSFFLPFIWYWTISEALYQFLHVLLLEYLPFIILLFSLYTISGGIRIKGKLSGTPKGNTLLILIGTILASWMGTTGAAMLLIRPLLRANKWRKNNVHTVVFFIFLVANIGGALTPLGDPPLFLGFLKGIDFFWPIKMMLFPMCLASILLLILYFIIDSIYYRMEGDHKSDHQIDTRRIGIEGVPNIVLLICVVVAVLLSGIWNPQTIMNIYGVEVEIQNICRDFILVLLALLSWHLTSTEIRNKNGFTWFPMLEVAKLFAGIFITIIPAIAILKAGSKGDLSIIIQMVTDADGPINIMYFWFTGILSSFLDNAPTYLVFFEMAGSYDPTGGKVADFLMNEIPTTLMAISAGSVFMGAMTYIGNAPNFMVQSIAEENNVKMPTFLGYLLWSSLILIPIYFVISVILF